MELYTGRENIRIVARDGETVHEFEDVDAISGAGAGVIVVKPTENSAVTYLMAPGDTVYVQGVTVESKFNVGDTVLYPERDDEVTDGWVHEVLWNDGKIIYRVSTELGYNSRTRLFSEEELAPAPEDV